MQKPRDFTKPNTLVSASTYTLISAGRDEKIVNRKNIMETSKTSSCGWVCQVCVASSPLWAEQEVM